jgi:hypothetical protein
MKRQDLITMLIDRRIDSIYQGGGPEGWIRELLAHGPQGIYGGYNNMEDEDLIAEWNEELDEDEDEQIGPDEELTDED